MAEFHVEIDEVREDEPALWQALEGLKSGIQQSHVAGSLDLLAGAAMGEDVANLSDRDDLPVRFRQPVEDRWLRGFDRPVLAVRRALEGSALLTDKGPGDHAANREGPREFAHHGADLVKPRKAENRLMRRDLRHGICRGVKDRLAARAMLLAEFLDDLRA